MEAGSLVSSFLFQHLTAKFKLSEFHDTYRENVERLIDEKKKGEKITTVKQPREARF